MSIDKKIYSALIACFLLILGVSILFAIPRVIDNYRMSVQDSLAADVAGRFNTYLYAAAAEMAETASSPALQSWEPGGRQPDLSQLKNGLSFFFNDFFLFNSSSEMIKSSTAYSARLKLPMDRRAALHKPGRPFPAVVTGPDGIKTIALCVPLFNQRGQQSGWLAGSLNTGVLRSGQTNFYLAGDKFLLYLCDGEDLIPLFEGQAGKAETEGLKAMKNPSAARRINIGNMSMVSADVGYPGWSVVAVMHRAQSNAVLAGENIKITLPLVLISLILVVLTALYMNNLLSPVIKLLSKLGSALNGDIRAGVDSLPKGLDAAIGSMKVLESVPIGIMVVDTGGFIRYFNSEAGEITGREPSSVTGKPMKDFFPNNYYNYTMESIVTQREYLGLRNIIMVDDFFKELLLDISPLYNNGTVTGAVATFQDVTPQRKMIEVKAAYTLARDLALQKDLDSTVEVIAKAASEMAETEYSAVFIADQDGSLLIKSSFGIPQKTVDKYNSRPYKTDGPEITDLYRNKAPLLHDDVRNKINLKPILIVPDVMSFYSFPIFCEDHLIGLINLYSLEKNKLSRDRIYLIRSLSGQISAAISNFHEFQKMRAMASVDGLTGLFNKKYFLENIAAEIKTAATEGSPLSLAMLDIDYFKKLNDSYGHQVGDQVLVEVSAILRQSLRETDIVCRYGGEEFSIIMPGTTKDRAVDVIERVRSRVESSPMVRSDQENIFITISCGVACCPGDAGDAETLILRSDTALYTAKGTGRNKVVGYDPEQTIG